MFLIRFAKLFLNDVIITCLKVITILLEFKLLVYIIHFGLIFQLHIYCEYYLNLFGYCNLYPVVQESNTLNSFSVLFIFVSQYLPLFHPCIAISVLSPRTPITPSTLPLFQKRSHTKKSL